MFLLACQKLQLTLEFLHLTQHGVPIPRFDGANRRSGVDHPRLKRVIGRHEAQRANRNALRDVIIRHHHRIGTDCRQPLEGHIANDEIFLGVFQFWWDDRHHVVDEIIAGAPDFHARRQTSVVAKSEKAILAAPDAAPVGNMRESSDFHARGEVAEVIHDGAFANFEVIRVADADIFGNDGRYCR